MLLSAAVLLIAATPILANSCNDGYTEVNEKCYKYFNDKRKYEDAQQICKNNGGNLAWLSDYTETIDVVDALNIDKYFWIGAMLEKEDDDYFFKTPQDGKRVSLNDTGFWDKREPKLEKDYECVQAEVKKAKKGRHKHYRSKDGLKWKLKKCKDKKYFLCEQLCGPGQTFCGGIGCVSDPSECSEVGPPLSSCDATHNFVTDGLAFQSSGYESDRIYPSSRSCVYKLFTSSDSILQILFTAFDLDTDNNDFIEVYLGSNDRNTATFLDRFDNKKPLAGRRIYSTNNLMIIVLKSDGRTGNDGRGFVLNNIPFSTPPSVLGESITVMPTMYFIESPGFTDNHGELPAYTASWTFTAPLFNQIIFLLDSESSLDAGSELEIRCTVGGADFLLVKFMRGDNHKQRSYISTTRSCTAYYRTALGVHWKSRGFKLGYRTASGCSQIINGFSGTLESPGYDTYADDIAVPYPVNYECTYQIIVPTNFSFSYNFSDDFGIDFGDVLEIQNVGVSPPTTWTITGYNDAAPQGLFPGLGFLYVKFTTNAITTTRGIRGFKIDFSKDCSNLYVTPWTHLSRSRPYRYGDDVYINCTLGYEFQDNGWEGVETTISCLRGGNWNVERIPQCEPIYCGPAPQIKDGNLDNSSGVLFGDWAKYHCLDGLMLVGNDTVTCTDNKTWSQPPMCVPVLCMMEQPMDNISSHSLRNDTAATINDSTYAFRSVVELDCVDGYYVDGVRSIVCQKDGTWNGELGTCEKRPCFYHPISNGLMSQQPRNAIDIEDLWRLFADYYYSYTTLPNFQPLPSVLFEEMLYVHCRDGFLINGTNDESTLITCAADGSFEGIPDCVEVNECAGDPCQQTCADRINSFECSCSPEFELVNDVNCTLIPGCEANTEACDQTCTSTDLPEWFKCSCMPPYVLYERPGAHNYYIRSDDNSPLKINQSCVLPQCPLEQLAFAFNDKTKLLAQSNDTAFPFYYNDTVKVQCERGYLFPDGEQMKMFECTEYGGSLGWWDGSNNSLSDIMCSREATCDGSVIPIQGVNFSMPFVQMCDIPFAFNITSTCDLDPMTLEYRLFPDMECPEVDCGMPDSRQTLDNANRTVACTTLGCSFEFTCEDGSQPLPTGQPVTVVCMENEKWNYSNSYCDGTTCSDPGMVVGTHRYPTEDMVENMTFTLANLRNGGRVFYKCIREGYELFNTDSNELVNSTYCNGITFTPDVANFECRDTQPPTIDYCPEEIEVFRYSKYPDFADFMGYFSPTFFDNGGIRHVAITPQHISKNYRFYQDTTVQFTATDHAMNSPVTCSVNFKVVDVKTPVLTCGELNVQVNETHPKVNITDEMVLSVVQIDTNHSTQVITVDIAQFSNMASVERIKDRINQYAVVKVDRVFYSGDTAQGDMREDSLTVSSSCHVPIIASTDMCAEAFAPTPAGATKQCGPLEGGGRECNYTCTDADALFFQFSPNLYNTATSQCTNSSVGFSPIFDCVNSGYARALTAHIFFTDLNRPFGLACYEKLLNGYYDWAVKEICNNSVADIKFLNTSYAEVPLEELIRFSSSTHFTGFPRWYIIPHEGLEGTEAICNNKSREVDALDSDDQYDWSAIDSCLSAVVFAISQLKDVQYECPVSSDLVPVRAGESVLNGISYPKYGCFECPAGTYLDSDGCKACAVGQFQATSGTQDSCTECFAGTTTIEEGQKFCLLTCPDGYVSDTGVFPCRPCPAGTYGVNTTYCQECPADTQGLLNGQTSEDACRPACNPGYYSETGYAPVGGNCTACPVNFHNIDSKQTTCDPCGDGQDTGGRDGQITCSSSSPCGLTNCASTSCATYHGYEYCPGECIDSSAFRGWDCLEVVDKCDLSSCDPRGTSECANGICICNNNVATGELCDNITITCDGVSCENGGQCFVVSDGYEEAANLMPTCLCGAQWSGDSCTTVEDKCTDNPCLNGAQCVSEDVRARCDCQPGFKGYYCEIDIDGCESSPCFNRANCTDVAGALVTDDPFAFHCSCPDGFVGDQCETRVDACDEVSCGDNSICLNDYSSPNSVFCLNIFIKIVVNVTISTGTPSYCRALDIKCENGGQCVDDAEYRFRCVCPDSGIFGGIYCQHRIDFCLGNPCGVGNCTNKADVAGYTCSCPQGYVSNGNTCINVDECVENMDICNEGFCTDTPGSFYCRCKDGYAGQLCDTFINQCLFTNCYGNGTCVPTDAGFMCLCQPGRTGKLCQDELSLCQGQCENGGKCFEAFNNYICLCPPPAFGRHCENLPDPCRTQAPCSYGNCTAVGLEYTCDCFAGHTGKDCEVFIDDCYYNPCKSGGTCKLEATSGFTCDCKPGFAGDLCEEKLNPCSPDPCPNAATCVPQGFYDFSCVCPSGLVGDNCNTAIDVEFEFYIRLGQWAQVNTPTESPNWSTGKFSLSAWIRPDRIIDDDGDFVDIISVMVESEVILRLTAHGAIFNNMWYNYTSSPDFTLPVGYWAFVAVSVDTVEDTSTITLYNNGLVAEYSLSAPPAQVQGRLNVVLSPGRQYVGFCSQVYLWAGASFSKSAGSGLSALYSLPVGTLVFGDSYQGSFIQYYWSVGTFRTTPFCEVGRPPSYCVVCNDNNQNIGTYLEFRRGCPDDMVVTTSARSVAVTWDPPIFLANGQVLASNPPNIEPGSYLSRGRHRVRYSATKNGKRLKCSFKIYVRFGCDGEVFRRRCIRPYRQPSITYAQAQFRCANVGGGLLMVENLDQKDRVFNAIRSNGLVGSQVMVESYIGSSARPACVTLDDAGNDLPGTCTNAVAVICDRGISASESCVLPNYDDQSVTPTLVSSNLSPVKKYRLTCVNQGQVLPSYIPKYLTCYPEGNWGTALQTIPNCVTPAPRSRRFRFRIVIRFRIRIRSPCGNTGVSSITGLALGKILNVLNRLSNRFGSGAGKLIKPGRVPRKCCNNPGLCPYTRSQCMSNRFALRCSCRGGILGRKKRAADNELDFDMDLDELPDSLSESGSSDSLTPEQVITQAVANNEFLNELASDLDVSAEDNPNPLDSFSALSTLDCEEGFEDIDGEECAPCDAGTYWLNGTCEFCPLNTYQNDSSQTNCTDCPDGTITYLEGSTSLDDCAPIATAGTFYNSLTRQVENCSLGFYQPDENQQSCLECDQGLTTLMEGSNSSSQCLNLCPSGQENGPSGCEPCDIGKYRDASADLICIDCPTGWLTESTGSISQDFCNITDCPMGTYRNITTNECVNCSRGSYQNQPRQEMCEPCGDNFTTMAEGSQNEADCKFICPNGYERSGVMEQCTPCAFAKYRAKNISAPNEACMDCPTYYNTTSVGSVDLMACSVLECPAGMQATSDNTSCELCPLNTFSDSVTFVGEECTACQMDYFTYSMGANSSSDCKLNCSKAGEEDTGIGSCTLCKKGFYALDQDQQCRACDANLTIGVASWDTHSTGSQAQSDCSVALCSPGYFRNNNSDPETCDPCATGFFQINNLTTVASCERCPLTATNASQTTLSTGSDREEDCLVTCPTGQEDEGDTCTDCPVGKYKETAGPHPCQECPAGLTTSAVGSINRMNCSTAICGPGNFSDGDVCSPCPKGEYQEMDNFTGSGCEMCQPINGFNTTTTGTGSDSESDCYAVCDAGYIQDDERGCDACPVDTYMAPNASVCVPCDSSFSTNGTTGGTNASACTHRKCGLGEENGADPTTCVSCSLNTYKPEGFTSCENCLDGRITKMVGSIKVEDCILNCSAGHEYNANADRCAPCEKGKYRDLSVFNCDSCDANTTTAGVGSSSCPVPKCMVGEYAKEANGAYTCTACPINTYQHSSGSLSCVPCPTGKMTNSTGSTSESDCFDPPTCENTPCPDEKHSCTDTENGPTCSCPSAYDAVGQDSCKHKCKRENQAQFCANDGRCNDHVDEISLLCTCYSGYTGINCTEIEDTSNVESRNVLIIVGVVSGLVLVGAVIGGIVAFIKSKTAAAAATSKGFIGSGYPTSVNYPSSMMGQPHYADNSIARAQMRQIEDMNPDGGPQPTNNMRQAYNASVADVPIWVE